MVKVCLNCAQKFWLRVMSKVKCRQLQRLRERSYCRVKASHAFTGDSKEFEVTCIEDLRACLEDSMCFGKARIFYENRELSDFDGIEAHVTFIQESVPDKAIRYLWRNGVRFVDDNGVLYVDGRPRVVEVAIQSAFCALGKMDLLPHHVNRIILWAQTFDVIVCGHGYRHLLPYMGMVIGRACVGLMSIPEKFEIELMVLSKQREVPLWMLKAFAEVRTQQPSILEPYTLLIVKGTFRFVREHFGRRRKYLTTIQQLALDELLNLEKEMQQSKGVQATGYVGIDEHVLKLRRFVDPGCHCTSCKSRAAILGMLMSDMTCLADSGADRPH